MSLSDDFKRKSKKAEHNHDLSLRTVCDALASIALQNEEKIEQEAFMDCLYEEKTACERLLYNTVKNQKQHTWIFEAGATYNGLKQRYQGLAQALAQLGQKVIYINPELEADISETANNESENLMEYALDYVREHIHVEDGVIVCQPISLPKYHVYTYLELSRMLVDTNPNPVVVIQNIRILPIVDDLKKRGLLIYDCVDDHTDYEHAFWSSKEICAWYEKLEKKADVLLTTASSLFLTKLRETKKPVFLSRNAVYASEFAIDQPTDIPEDIAAIPGPRIGYIGYVSNWFDRALFYELAKHNPDKSFVIVGIIRDNWITAKYPNIYLLGPKPHEALHDYYKAMDICLIPFKDNTKISMACDPVKIYEQIACNVPTITTFMPDTAIGKPLVYHSNTYEDMQADIDEILMERPSLSMEEIEQCLLENSWHVRAAQLIRIAENKIVNMETPEYTLAELTAQFEEMKKYHPNFEILYALCCQNTAPDVYRQSVEHAYSLSHAPFIAEEYRRMHGYLDKLENTYIDIFNPPSDMPEDTWVEIMWFNTFWCNNNCEYCHEVHDRKAGHAFDIASPEKWAECINQIKVPFTLNISGGETFLDHKNFIQFYNLVIDNPLLMHVRIDTNTTIPAEFLKSMKIQKTSLMTSYHPSRHTVQESIRAIQSYKELGFDISMVNYVCHGKQMETFRELQPVYEKENLTLAASLYFGSDAANDNDTLKEYMKSLDKEDIGFKTCFQTKGAPCHAASHLLTLDFNGQLRNCWSETWNLFDCHAMISLTPRSCPMTSCNCISKYSMLDLAKRDIRHSLDDYVRTYTEGNQTKIILITGYLGCGNFGDELLLEALLKKLRKIPNVLPIALCFGSAEKAAEQHNILTVSLFDEERIAMLTCLCDCLILGPGGLLEDYAGLDPKAFYSHNAVYSYLYPVMMAHLNGKPTYSIGLGAGPFRKEETKNAIRMMLQEMELIFARDRYSVEALNACGIGQARLAADMAFTYPFEQYCRPVETGTIGINLRETITLDMKKLLVEMCRYVSLLVSSGYNIKMIMFPDADEKKMADVFVSMASKLYPETVGKLQVVSPTSIEDTIGEISSVEAMAAMRLHTNIACANCHVPSVFLSYDEKVAEAARLLGMDEYLVEAGTADAEKLFRKTIKLLKEKEEIVQIESKKCQKLKQIAEEAFDSFIQKFVQ